MDILTFSFISLLQWKKKREDKVNINHQKGKNNVLGTVHFHPFGSFTFGLSTYMVIKPRWPILCLNLLKSDLLDFQRYVFFRPNCEQFIMNLKWPVSEILFQIISISRSEDWKVIIRLPMNRKSCITFIFVFIQDWYFKALSSQNFRSRIGSFIFHGSTRQA